MRGKPIILEDGTRIVVTSLTDAIRELDCQIDELGEWIKQGWVESAQCPNCRFRYPVTDRLHALVDVINSYPTRYSVDEIIQEEARRTFNMRRYKGDGLRQTGQRLPQRRR